jgi:hypothetical protein
MTEGVWVAFNWDGSAFVPFASELEAYRYASGLMMNVRFARYGDDEWMRGPEKRPDDATVSL